MPQLSNGMCILLAMCVLVVVLTVMKKEGFLSRITEGFKRRGEIRETFVSNTNHRATPHRNRTSPNVERFTKQLDIIYGVKERYTDKETDLKIAQAVSPTITKSETLDNMLQKVNEEVSKTKDETGIISTKYNAIEASLNETIAKNTDSMKDLTTQIDGAKQTMLNEVGAFNERLNKLRAPIIQKTEADADGYVKNADYMKDVPVGTLFLASGENQADKYWDGSRLRDFEGRPIKKEVVDIIYPIGSIMIRYDQRKPTELPGFEHTEWEQFEGDYVLSSTKVKPNTTGGLGWITEAIKLTTGMLPKHKHEASTAEAGVHKHEGKVSSDGAHSHANATTNSTGAHGHTFVGQQTSGFFRAVQRHEWNDGTIFRNIQNSSGGYKYGGGDSEEKRIEWKHTPQGTINSNGVHSHTVNIPTGGGHSHNIKEDGKHTHTITVKETGNNESHSHKIDLPKINVAVWRRTK